ncbi:hypothetical protein D3C73_1455090 [compost metagenome]
MKLITKKTTILKITGKIKNLFLAFLGGYFSSIFSKLKFGIKVSINMFNFPLLVKG